MEKLEKIPVHSISGALNRASTRPLRRLSSHMVRFPSKRLPRSRAPLIPPGNLSHSPPHAPHQPAPQSRPSRPSRPKTEPETRARGSPEALSSRAKSLAKQGFSWGRREASSASPSSGWLQGVPSAHSALWGCAEKHRDLSLPDQPLPPRSFRAPEFHPPQSSDAALSGGATFGNRRQTLQKAWQRQNPNLLSLGPAGGGAAGAELRHFGAVWRAQCDRFWRLAHIAL